MIYSKFGRKILKKKSLIVCEQTPLCSGRTESEAVHRKLIKMEKMEESYRNLLENIGEDPNREGLLKTPKRFKLYERYDKVKLMFKTEVVKLI